MEIILAVIYLLSPVPLLIFALAERSAKKKAIEEIKFLKLQLKKKSMQPGIREDVPVVTVSDDISDDNSALDPAQKPVTDFTDQAQKPVTDFVASAQKPAASQTAEQYSVPEDLQSIYVQPVLPFQFQKPAEESGKTPETVAKGNKQPVFDPYIAQAKKTDAASAPSAPSAPGPAPMPQSVSENERPRVNVPKQPDTMPAEWSPAPANPNKNVIAGFSEFSENRSLICILVVGVILVLLALVGFISATWSNLSVGARAAWLFSFSFILLATGIFARAKLHLTNTSIALYSIGSAALPITVIGSAAFKLFGDYFTLELPNIYNTLILALVGLFVLLAFGAIFFESNVFAAGSLISVSAILFCLALQNNNSEYRLNVLLIAVFAALAIVLIPLVKRIPEYSAFRPFAEVYETYSIVNLYFMTIVSFFLSGTNRYAGIFLIGLGIIFLHVAVLSKENGHLSLPSVVLFLVGTGLLIRPNTMLNSIIWMLTVSACTLAMSVLYKKYRILSITYAIVGILFLFGVSVPLFYYVLIEETTTPLPLLLTLPAIAGALYITLRYKKAYLAISGILPVFTLLLGSSLHILINVLGEDMSEVHADLFPLVSRLVLYLTAMIIAGIMYALFCAIPHHRFYTATGEFLLFLQFAFWSYLFVVEFPENKFPSYHAVSIIGCFFFLLLTLFQAMRTDRLNVRDLTVYEEPQSITFLRGVYAVIWPIFPVTYLEDTGRHLKNVLPTATLVCIGFACIFFLIRSYTRQKDSEESDRKSSLPRFIVFLAASLTAISELAILCNGLPVLEIREAKGINILIHFLPFLIPAVLFYAGFRLRKSLPKAVPVLNLCGMYAASLCFAYVMDLFRVYDVPDNSGIAPAYFHPVFYLALIALAAAVYYAIRTDRDQPERSGLIWVATVCPVLFLCRAFDGRISENAIIAIAIGAAFLLSAWILDRKYRPIAHVLIVLFGVHYLQYMQLIGARYSIPGIGQVLLYQIPVVLFVIPALLAQKRLQESKERNPFPSYALLFQILTFIAVPLLTDAKSTALLADLVNIGEYERIRQNANLINHIFEGGLFYFNDSFFLPFAVPGFLLVGLLYYYLEDDYESRRRVLALSAVLLSTLVSMRLPGTFSLAENLGQLHLLWPTLLVVLLPFIIPSIKTPEGIIKDVSFEQLQFVYTIICLVLLGLAAISTESVVDLMFYAIVSFGVLLVAYLMQKDRYLKVGVVAVISLVIYMIRKIWGDKAWWIYFGITGVTLIVIGIRNEMKKRFK